MYEISIILAISTGLYGMNVALSASCLYLLTTTRGQTQYRPVKMVAFHIYILGMLGLATYAAVDLSQNLALEGQPKTLWPEKSSPGNPQGEATISLPFIFFGADAFMVRMSSVALCIMLSKFSRFGGATFYIKASAK